MAITEPSQVPRPPGRPRNVAADREIVAATLRLLSREGYDGTSIEAVAAEAGVTRATVYRRYPTKADMVTAAVCEMAQAKDRVLFDNLQTAMGKRTRSLGPGIVSTASPPWPN